MLILAELVWMELADHAPQLLHYLVFSTPPETKSNTAVANICRCFHHPNQKNGHHLLYTVQNFIPSQNCSFSCGKEIWWRYFAGSGKLQIHLLRPKKKHQPVAAVAASRDVPAKKNGGKWFLEVPFLLDLQQSKWEFHMLFICMSNPPEVICPEHSNHPIEIIFSWHHPLSKIPLHFPLLVTLPNTLNHQGLQYVTYDQNHNPSLIQWSPESMGDRWVTQKEGEMPEIGWVCNHTLMKMVIWFWPSINSMPTTGSLGSV